MRARGFVLVGALVMVLVLGVLVTTATFSGYSNRINTSDALNAYKAQLAAEAGLDFAIYKLWHELWGSEKNRTYLNYVARLDKVLPLDPATKECSAPIGYNPVIEGSIRAEVQVRRCDVLDTNTNEIVVSFEASSTGWLADNYTARKLQQTFQVREPHRGFDFALLTNNANCIFCHTRVRPLEALGGAPSAQQPWTRVKIGVLESLEVRRSDDPSATKHDAKSFVAGTVYTRGQLNISKFTNDGGVPYASETVAGGIPDMRFKTLQNPSELKITNETLKSFVAVDCKQPCERWQNFYFNYPDIDQVQQGLEGRWPDDELPKSFPLPIEDANADRRIDDTEWSAAVSKSTQGLDANNLPGQLLGGRMFTNPVGLTDWPSSGNASSINSGTKANLVLDGQAIPLTINGTVYVDGDVILRGKVQGKGKLIARGNVYVMGDVVYECTNLPCTPQQYADGARNPESTELPHFALSAVGNIVIGDYLTPRYGNALDDSTTDPGCLNPSQRGSESAGCGTFSFTMQEIGVFNEKELVQALGDPLYTPRFYTLVKDQPVYFNSYALVETQNGKVVEVYNPEGGSSYWYTEYLSSSRAASDQVRVHMGGKNITITGTQAKNILARAVVVSLVPAEGWVSGSTLKRLWNNSIERLSTRPVGDYRFDGLLYSANGIFSIIRNTLNPSVTSKTKGSWDLRGALVAADTGVLTPGSANRNEVGGLDPTKSAALSIFYDQRMAQFFTIRDFVKMYRSDWKVVAR